MTRRDRMHREDAAVQGDAGPGIGPEETLGAPPSMRPARTFLYVPWIKVHGDMLVEEVFALAPHHTLAPFRIVADGDERGRRALIHFAARRPATFARMIERRLRARMRRGRIDAIVLTLDWVAPMRVLARVAQRLGIPVVVVPHESVFFDAHRFYRNPLDGASVPVADLFLCWGERQREVLAARGYPAERMRLVSSPKLEGTVDRAARLSRALYAERLGLDPERPIVLFAGQTLDNVSDLARARIRQIDALADVSEAVRALGCQLVIRMPPVDHSLVMERGIRDRLAGTGHPVVRFDAARPETYPREALHHCDCVVSVSSTMLLEKALMNGPSLALDYINDVSPFVSRGGLPAARSRAEIEIRLRALIGRSGHAFPAKGWACMERDYSAGGFGRTDPGRAILTEIEALPAPRPASAPPKESVAALRALGDALERQAFTAAFNLPFGRQLLGRLLPIPPRRRAKAHPLTGREGESRA